MGSHPPTEQQRGLQMILRLHLILTLAFTIQLQGFFLPVLRSLFSRFLRLGPESTPDISSTNTAPFLVSNLPGNSVIEIQPHQPQPESQQQHHHHECQHHHHHPAAPVPAPSESLHLPPAPVPSLAPESHHHHVEHSHEHQMSPSQNLVLAPLEDTMSSSFQRPGKAPQTSRSSSTLGISGVLA